MTPNEAPTTTNPYRLSRPRGPEKSPSIGAALRRLAPVMAGQGRSVVASFVATIAASSAALVAPIIIGRTVDTSIRNGDFAGVLRSAAVLLGAYVVGLVATYVQTQQMGTVGRRVLFNLRNALFTKLQALPLDFFNQNKAGDLISRINNDTDKLNQFFSQALVQLAANLFLMTGAALFILSLNVRLGVAALAPAAAVLVVTRATGGVVKRRNMASLQSLGGLSGEIQESLSNFRVIVAFNRADYFQRAVQRRERAQLRRLDPARASRATCSCRSTGWPTTWRSSSCWRTASISIAAGSFTVGLLIGFLLYVNSFYMPLRQLAAVWTSFQLAMASLDRISEVLALEPNLPQLPPEAPRPGAALAFDQVQFSYVPGQPVLRDATFSLDARQDVRARGPDGRGQDDHGVADGAALRSDGRAGAPRRPRHPHLFARRARAEDRLHPAGAVPVHRHGPREHRLRQRGAAAPAGPGDRGAPDGAASRPPARALRAGARPRTSPPAATA